MQAVCWGRIGQNFCRIASDRIGVVGFCCFHWPPFFCISGNIENPETRHPRRNQATVEIPLKLKVAPEEHADVHCSTCIGLCKILMYGEDRTCSSDRFTCLTNILFSSYSRSRNVLVHRQRHVTNIDRYRAIVVKIRWFRPIVTYMQSR